MFSLSGYAYAGMPPHIIKLTELSSSRLSVISFFLLVIFVGAIVVKILWNNVAVEITPLPKLTYWKSLGLIFLWGFVFNLILTMISGARELMTPGAWELNGVTYKLKNSKSTKEKSEDDRKKHLEYLRKALWHYANEHDGQLPTSDYLSNIPDYLWETVHDSKMRYIYRYQKSLDQDQKAILVYEPAIFGYKSYVLFSNGQIDCWSISKIEDTLKETAYE